MKMTKFKAQMSNPNFKFEEFFLPQAGSFGFDIDLTFGIWHLALIALRWLQLPIQRYLLPQSDQLGQRF